MQAVITSRCHRRDLLPAGLPDAGTHAHTRTYTASPFPRGLFSLCNHQITCAGSLLPLPLGTLPSATLGFAEFSSHLLSRYCALCYPSPSLLCVRSIFLGWPGLSFAIFEIPSVVDFSACLHNLWVEISFFFSASPAPY